MTSNYSDTDLKAGRRRTRSKKTLWIIVGVLIGLVVAIGLGVGLGLGLTRRNNSDDGGDSGNGTISNGALPPYPQPTGNITDRVFWQPSPGTSWQIVLLDPITISQDATQATPDVDAFDIDLFTNPQNTMTKLKSLGKHVICYFSAGSYEPGRPDSDQFLPSDLGHGLDGWPGEYWLQTNSPNVRKIMSARIKLASGMGCDAIDPDNIDGFVSTSIVALKQC